MDRQQPLEFGQRLRQLREAAGLTQEELAERAGVSVKAIGALERGRRQRPYPNTLLALSNALNLTEAERAELAGSLPERTRQQVVSANPPSALPAPPTPLIGREREIEEITRLFRDEEARLVTLTGAGGVGKTRLALEAATRLESEVQRPAIFVSLASLSDPAVVLSLIAHAVGLSEIDDMPVRSRLVIQLRERPCLIVLDSAERVLDIAPAIAELLADCPDLVLLVTSRAPLKIRAELEYPVRPLELPDLNQVPSLDDVESNSSVRLFVQRAVAAAPSFQLTQGNCAAIAAICRRLDGLPLAIELAASRIRSLSPTELLARLDRTLPLLVGGSRDLPERQQTMRSAISWSYELLPEAQQILFRRVSVFSGGWTLATAESVVSWGGIAVDDVLDLLSGLVEQSLVVVDVTTSGLSRYRMLEPIRQFATQQVLDYEEEHELASRHLVWCIEFVQRAAEHLRGPDQGEWFDRLEQEHDNLRAALAASQRHDTMRGSGLQLATSLWLFWEVRGHLTEGRRWLDAALSTTAVISPDQRADAVNAAGNLARDQGDHSRAVELHGESLELRRQTGDRHGVGRSLVNLGNVMLDQGDYDQASRHYAEALELFRQIHQTWDVANALNNLGIAFGYLGDDERATEMLEEALAIRKEMGELASQARSLDALGVLRYRRGELEQAARLHAESLELRRQLGDKRGIGIALNNLGAVARTRGELATAARLAEESLTIRREIGDRHGEVLSLSVLADVARERGDQDAARSLFLEALTLQRRAGIRDGIADNLLGIAVMAADGGELEQAARLLGASGALRQAMNQAPTPISQEVNLRLTAHLHRELGADVFSDARRSGESMTLEEAFVEARMALESN